MGEGWGSGWGVRVDVNKRIEISVKIKNQSRTNGPINAHLTIAQVVRWMTQVKKNRCTPRGTKVVIYHLVGNFMLNSMQNVVSLATCAESL